MNFMIGCNYWDSKSGTNMWRNWDAESVRNDLNVLSENGVEVMRVFPNWRDFQPVMSVKEYGGAIAEYLFADETRIDNEFGIDYNQMEHFSLLCDYAKEFNLKLVVSILTGWMSGRLFVPPVLEGKNLITNPESLMWESKFIKGFVRYFKDRPEIIAWDLGNECNCMGLVNSRHEAYAWTSLVRNAIHSEDTTRPIMSGMHSLTNGKEWPGNNEWTVQDQGEICDILTPHTYPSPSIIADREPCNTMRPTLAPAAQCIYYSGIGKKPAMIQETGINVPTQGSEELGADWLRATMLSGWANGSLGYLWWCAHEHLHVDAHPYNAYMIERQLGLVHTDFTPKKAAVEMKRLGKMLHELPFEKLPERDAEAVVCVSRNQPSKSNFTAAFVLAKQAGFDVDCCFTDQEIPEKQLYIVPSNRGWSPFSVKFWLDVRSKAENGATVLFTDSQAAYTEIEQVFGFESLGRGAENQDSTVTINGCKLDFNYGGYNFEINPIDADVLLKDDNGKVLLTEHKYGKGKICFLNFPLEEMLGNGSGTLNHPDEKPYYLIYKMIAKEIINNRLVKTENPFVSVTQHRFDDRSAVIVAINNTDTVQKCGFNFDNVNNVELLYGNKDELTKCEAVIMKVDY